MSQMTEWDCFEAGPPIRQKPCGTKRAAAAAARSPFENSLTLSVCIYVLHRFDLKESYPSAYIYIYIYIYIYVYICIYTYTYTYIHTDVYV